MSATGVKKGLALIFIANLINLIIGLVNGFVLPKFLSIESYAAIKTFTLYSTYAGVFHLGYLDGMYLKYGGAKMELVAPREYGKDFWNIFLMQSIVSVLFLLLGFILNDFIIKAFAVSLFFRNVTSCFQMFFQATGEFKLYSSALNYGTIGNFVLCMLLVFVFKTDNSSLYISAQVFAQMVVCIYLGLLLNSKIGFLKFHQIDLQGFKENIDSGFVLMIGNFSNNLFSSIDRWIVKVFMVTASFAVYSFAVSIDALITVFITPIYITLYNSFCQNHTAVRVKQIKNVVLVWAFCIILLAFPAKWVIEHYLDKYIDSLPLIFILFSTQVFYAVIKGVYVNYFKSVKKQQQYFWQMMIMLTVAIILGVLAYFVFHSLFAIAMSALITALVWLVFNEIIHEDFRFSLREWVYILLLVSVFIISGVLLPTIIGASVYITSLAVLSFTIMKDETILFIKTAKQFVLNKLSPVIR